MWDKVLTLEEREKEGLGNSSLYTLPTDGLPRRLGDKQGK